VSATEALEPDELLFPAEVAQMFRVDVKTVTRWADAGKLETIRTAGGHRRYVKASVRALIEESRRGARS
jgi:excisionase family DNA binding protein